MKTKILELIQGKIDVLLAQYIDSRLDLDIASEIVIKCECLTELKTEIENLEG